MLPANVFRVIQSLSLRCRYISPGGEEQAVFRNGTVITLFRDGRKETEFSNGQKETLCVANTDYLNYSTVPTPPEAGVLCTCRFDFLPTGIPMVQRSAHILTVLCVFYASMEARVPRIQMARTESKVCVLCDPFAPNLNALFRCKWAHHRAIGLPRRRWHIDTALKMFAGVPSFCSCFYFNGWSSQDPFDVCKVQKVPATWCSVYADWPDLSFMHRTYL